MTPFERRLRREAQKIRIGAVLKRELKDRITTYIEYHPLSTPAPRVGRAYAIGPFASVRFNIASWQSRSLVGAFAVVLLIGVPYAAERAVPGDVLYPVKVRVNEEVRSQLALSPYEKIEWETRRVERRIAEARLLAREGRLTDEMEAEISEIVREHAREATKGIAALHETNADEAAVAQIALESALDIQTVVLETDDASPTVSEGEDKGMHGSQIRNLAKTVRTAKAGIIADGLLLNASTTPSYERFMGRVETETARAHELFRSISASMSSEEQREVERRLEDIDRQIAAAEDAHVLDAAGNAVVLLRSALSDTQKLIAFMTNIDIRNSVKLESLVPKKLTEDERIAAIEVEVSDLQVMRDEVLSWVGSSDDVSLREKVLLGIDELDTLLRAVTNSTTTRDIRDAEEALSIARTLGDELVLMAGNLPASTTTNEAVGGGSRGSADDESGDPSSE